MIHHDYIGQLSAKSGLKIKELAHKANIPAQRLYGVKQGNSYLTQNECSVLEAIASGAPYEPLEATSVKEWYSSLQRRGGLRDDAMAAQIGISVQAYRQIARYGARLSISQLKKTIVRIKLDKKETDVLKKLYFESQGVPDDGNAGLNSK